MPKYKAQKWQMPAAKMGFGEEKLLTKSYQGYFLYIADKLMLTKSPPLPIGEITPYLVHNLLNVCPAISNREIMKRFNSAPYSKINK